MKKLKITAVISVFLFLQITACGTSGATEEGTVNINYNEYRQEIDGFGGSNAWTRPPRYEEEAAELVKLLFSKTEGMGFTILRNRIPFRERLTGDPEQGLNDGFVVRKDDNTYDYTTNADGTKSFNLNWSSWDLSGTRTLIEYIQDLGKDGPEKLVIMSTPWTPPNNRVTQWKEDVTGVNDRLNGKVDPLKPDMWGKLKRDRYNDYADLLADYVMNFEYKMGAPLSILSVQNEPNYKVEYESAYWGGGDIRDFLKVIARRFTMKGVTLGEGGLGIMAPEYENFNINFTAMIKPSLDDPESEKVLTHIALHQYNGPSDASTRAGSKEFPEIIAAGKRFWQTEVSSSNLVGGSEIANAIYYARMIHYDLTLAQTNAFLYWWLWQNGSGGNFPGALIQVDEDEIKTSLRLYAMGQYSRFIRPGWFRIDCDTSPIGRIYSSAYRNPETDEIAVVIINDRNISVKIDLNLNGAVFNRLDSWRTSEKEMLKSIGRQRASGNTATVVLSPGSITTFYGTVKE